MKVKSRHGLTPQAAAQIRHHSPTPNRVIGERMAAQFGWTGQQWSCLDELWTRESGWNHRADNPTSTAAGIAQFLDGTWSTVGARKTSAPQAQIVAGLTYIKTRYGSPCGAWSAWWAHGEGGKPHWY